MSDLINRIREVHTSVHPRPTFTLESDRGETHRHSRPVLYAHSTYERSSVLAGQPRRLFVEEWETWEEARAALAEVRRADRPCDGCGDNDPAVDLWAEHPETGEQLWLCLACGD